MRDEVKDALTDIDGVGDATAEKILDTLDEHGVFESRVDVDALMAALPRGRARRAAREVLD